MGMTLYSLLVAVTLSESGALLGLGRAETVLGHLVSAECAQVPSQAKATTTGIARAPLTPRYEVPSRSDHVGSVRSRLPFPARRGRPWPGKVTREPARSRSMLAEHSAGLAPGSQPCSSSLGIVLLQTPGKWGLRGPKFYFGISGNVLEKVQPKFLLGPQTPGGRAHAHRADQGGLRPWDVPCETSRGPSISQRGLFTLFASPKLETFLFLL